MNFTSFQKSSLKKTLVAFLITQTFVFTACRPTHPVNIQGPFDEKQVLEEQLDQADEEMNLIKAAEEGDLETVINLLDQGASLNGTDNRGVTPLIAASYRNQIDVAIELINRGADVNIGDNNGVLPIDHARRLGFTDMVMILEQSVPSLFPTPSPLVSLPFFAVTPTESDLPSALTQHPLFPYTIFGLRDRAYPGGEIVLQRVLEQSDAFTRYYINYPSDDLTITGILHLPTGPGPFPVLILLHGYIERDLYFSGADTWQAAEFFARQGYLVLAPDLRSWGESDPGLSLFHTGLVIDVLNLINIIPSLPQADATKIGLWGHSMGGGIVTKVLTIESRIRAAVLYAPNSADDADLLTRWGVGCLSTQSEAAGDHCNPAEIIPANTSSEIIEAYLIAAKDPEFLKAVAPIFHLEAISAPIQLHIGDDDGQFLAETPPAWSFKLVEALETHNKEIDYYIYPGQGHSFIGDSWVYFLQRSLTFFNQNLQGSP